MKYLLFVFFFFVYRSSYCQPAELQKAWPGFYKTSRGLVLYRPIQYGKIITNSGDTLTGKIAMDFESYKVKNTVSLLPLKKSQKEDIKQIRWGLINKIYVYADSAMIYFTVEFDHLYDGLFWRLMGKKGEVAIYDLFQSGSSCPDCYPHNGHKTIMIFGDRRITLIHNFQLLFHLKNIKPLLAKTIRRRYDSSFKRRGYKTVTSLVDYIIEAELRANSP